MAPALASVPLSVHDTGVSPSPSRRRLTAAYKRTILRDATRCTEPGDLAVLLERQLANATARAERAEGLVALQKNYLARAALPVAPETRAG